jgi:isoquinoline 1-oxidoreductase subunit alpha
VTSQVQTIEFELNGKSQRVQAEPDMPLLWVLRDLLGLNGTKYGCGRGLCGCCTVHIDGEAVRSCMAPIENVAGRRVVTIEGLAAEQDHPVLHAWNTLNVSQCGYCQTGQMMAAAALIAHRPQPSDEDIDLAMAGMLCRCGTYPRIRSAIRLAVKLQRDRNS